MRLLEYQSKKLLSDFGLSFTEPSVVGSVEAARAAFQSAGGAVVLKAQVPFGGRGKLGAVQFASTEAEVERAASQLIGKRIRGFVVDKILVERKIKSQRELYAGVTWDCGAKLPVALLSTSGGVDVEAAMVNQIARQIVNPFNGLYPHEGRQMARHLGFSGKMLVLIGEVLGNLANAFVTLDALTAEINPLVLTHDNSLIGLDARLEIDDDALFRQTERLSKIGDLTYATASIRPRTQMEFEAQRADEIDHRGVAGRVVEFDGDLCLIIGGGGASLTVFDAIRRHGGSPANYCEVGGNPTEEKVAALTRILLSKPGVRKVAVIMNVVNNTRADVIARGVLAGVRSVGRSPSETICVFRVPGSWEREARALLRAESIEALGRETALDECARLAVERTNTIAA